MAQVPYPHIESDGVLAFRKGDAIPEPTAKALKIDGKVLPGLDPAAGDFADAKVVITNTDDDDRSTPAATTGSAATPAKGAK